MGKTEYSLECEKCGVYNLEDGIIEKGKVYCNKCFEEIKEQRKKWRTYKNFKVKKVPITFKKKSGGKVTFMGRRLIKRKPTKVKVAFYKKK